MLVGLFSSMEVVFCVFGIICGSFLVIVET